MESAKPMHDMTELFGEVIHSYTRAQAIEDGYLVDVTETAREAGFVWPVAMTRAVWEDCVEWCEEDSKRQTHQDLSGRMSCGWLIWRLSVHRTTAQSAFISSIASRAAVARPRPGVCC